MSSPFNNTSDLKQDSCIGITIRDFNLIPPEKCYQILVPKILVSEQIFTNIACPSVIISTKSVAHYAAGCEFLWRMVPALTTYLKIMLPYKSYAQNDVGISHTMKLPDSYPISFD